MIIGSKIRQVCVYLFRIDCHYYCVWGYWIVLSFNLPSLRFGILAIWLVKSIKLWNRIRPSLMLMIYMRVISELDFKWLNYPIAVVGCISIPISERIAKEWHESGRIRLEDENLSRGRVSPQNDFLRDFWAQVLLSCLEDPSGLCAFRILGISLTTVCHES